MVETSIGKPDILPGEHKCLSIKGKALALSNIDGTYYCIDNSCTHAGGPLCEGKVEKNLVVCPWHESAFDYKTGKVVKGPAIEPVKAYPVKQKNGELFVKM